MKAKRIKMKIALAWNQCIYVHTCCSVIDNYNTANNWI